MKKRWRWNNEAVERSDLDSILDKVVRDLFARGDRPKHRRSGAARPPAKRRRQRFALEAIEPRLLLSADISYPTGITAATEFTLKAESGNVLKLSETANPSNIWGSATLSSAADVNVTIERAGGSVVQAAAPDTIHFDLDSFSNLNNFVAGNGGTLTINFTGGDQSGLLVLVQHDQLLLQGSYANLGFGLTLKSGCVGLG